jgi:two-component system chemotaxis response regulator CheB
MSTRVLIVDDSVFMRSMLRMALEKAPGMEVIATAQNGVDGLRKIEDLRPDVVTLDIEMPGLTGLQVLEQVMKKCPLPVVMVSTKTQEGAAATLDALHLGAVDYVAKPLGEKSCSIEGFRDKIIRAVHAAAASNRRRLGRADRHVTPAHDIDDMPPGVVVAIGISAGGPATLHEMMPAIPERFPPILITQHMPADFTGPFARRLDEACRIAVKEAAANDELLPGRALIAPGDRHLRVVRRGQKLVAALDDGPKVSGFRPSVDVLFESVASAVGRTAVGVVMTGMGCDGSVGVRLLKQQGAVTIAQDAETSTVYGMPKAAFQTGCIDRVEPLGRIPEAIAEAIASICRGRAVSAAPC